jgi:uncharacterized protein YkwD
MIRSTFRHAPRLEALESREVLSSGGPSAQAQQMLEMLNQARTNPAQMAERITSNLESDVMATVKHYNVDLNQVRNTIASAAPKQPLAWNQSLASAAQKHSQDQASNGFQSHTGSDGADMNTRVDREGYGRRTMTGENAYAYAKSVDHAMRAFLIDWGVASAGHRNNILQPDTPDSSSFREVGIGIASSNIPKFGPNVVTQDFGSREGAKANLLGVAFDDKNQNTFYDAGEGVGGVVIDIKNLATDSPDSVETWDQGGYQVELEPGSYQVSARVGDRVVRSQQVNIGTQNVKVDYNLSQPWSGETVVKVAAKAQTPAPTPAPAPKVEKKVEKKAERKIESTFDSSWITSWYTWTKPEVATDR